MRRPTGMGRLNAASVLFQIVGIGPHEAPDPARTLATLRYTRDSERDRKT